MGAWLDDSMRRAWSAVEFPEKTITEINVYCLFQNLVAPFGDDVPFSCIPVAFIERIGRPPRRWPFIRTAVEELFRTWRQESSAPSKKKRKVNNSPPLSVKQNLTESHAAPVSSVGGCMQYKETGDGHPRCTSAEDCVGTSNDPLVQHVPDTGEGDLYCQTCWEAFFSVPGLESLRAVLYDNPSIVFTPEFLSR